MNHANDFRTAKLVCFGRGSDTVEYGGGCHGSGYGTPERPHASEIREGKELVIPDGTPVIDKRAAIETPEGYAWVFRGPMVNVDLPDGGFDECPQPSAIMAGAMAENSYGGMLAVHLGQKARGVERGSLDHVSTREYVEGWKAVGARIGHYEGGQIVWHD